MTYKIRKGDICAVSERHSSTMMQGDTNVYWTHSIGRVRKANKQGNIIKEVTVYRQGGIEIHLREAGRYLWWWEAYTIPDPSLRLKAEAFLGKKFPTLDDMKKEIQK